MHERAVLPQRAQSSVILRGDFDHACDACIQGGEVFGGDPVFKDGLASGLVDFVLIQNDRRTWNRVTHPVLGCLTFQSRAILAAYSSLSTGQKIG